LSLARRQGVRRSAPQSAVDGFAPRHSKGIHMRRIVAPLTLLALLALAAGAHAYPTGSANQDIWSVANQELLFKELKNGYDVIYADYGSWGNECLNVANSEYEDWTDIYAWQCSTSEPTPNEEFRKPERTTDPYGNGLTDYIVPARQPHENEYCLNVERGVREEARIILWTCNNQENEDFWFG
jgi:hypothetical protein